MIILDRIRDESNFTDSEREIIKYILEHPQKVINATIEEFASLSYTSPSSIVRFAKKLGFKGYSEFRIKLAVEINSFLLNHSRIEVDMPVVKSAKKEEIAQVLMNLHYQTLTDVYHSLDLDAIQAVADLIWNSDYLMMRGMGPSLLIAQDFFYKIRRLGRLICECSSQVGFDNQFYPTARNWNQVLFVVSHYASTKSIRSMMIEAKACQIKIVLLTCNPNTPLRNLVDYMLVVDSGEADRSNKLGSFASRTGMTYLLDILYTVLFTKDYDLHVKQLYDFGVRVENRNNYLNEIKFSDKKK